MEQTEETIATAELAPSEKPKPKAAAPIDWFLASDRVVGHQHASLPDTINRGPRQILAASGLDPDAPFGGLLPTPNGAQQDDVLTFDTGAWTAKPPPSGGAPNPVVTTPVVASAAARDAMFPNPGVDQRVQRTDTGYVERYSGTKWNAETITRTAGAIISTQACGLVANGVVDDAPFLAAADAAAVASGGRHELDALVLPGHVQVMVKSDVTLTAHFRPQNGVKIYVAAGAHLAINGDFDPSQYARIFDPTSLGTISFGRCRRFQATWFGVVGDARGTPGVGTDDTAALRLLYKSVPDTCTVVFAAALVMMISNTVGPEAKQQVTTIGEAGVISDGTGAKFVWNGPVGLCLLDAAMADASNVLNSPSGQFTPAHVNQRVFLENVFNNPSGFIDQGMTGLITQYNSPTQVVLDTTFHGTTFSGKRCWSGCMFYVRSSDYCRVENLYCELDWRYDWQTGTGTSAGIGFLTDEHGIGGRVGTGCEFYHCGVHANNQHRRDFIGFGVAIVVGNNQEYHHFDHNHVYGAGYILQGDVTVTGPNAVTVTDGISATQVGYGPGTYVVLECAGPIVNGNRTAYVGQILAVTDATHFTVTPNPTTAAFPAWNNATAYVRGDIASVAGLNYVCLRAHTNQAPPAALYWSPQRGQVDRSYGYGLYVGASANAKGIKTFFNTFIELYRGIYLANGSLLSQKDQPSMCECDFELVSASEPCRIIEANSEQSRQSLICSIGLSLVFGGKRNDNIMHGINRGWYELNGGMVVTFIGNGLDQRPRGASVVYDFAGRNGGGVNFSGQMTAIGNHYPNGITMEQVGYNDAQGHPNIFGQVFSLGEMPIFGAPGRFFALNAPSYAGSYGSAGPIAHTAEIRTDGAPTQEFYGAMARAILTTHSNTTDVLVGHKATFGAETQFNIPAAYCYKAEFPTLDPAGWSPVWVGYRVTPANAASGAPVCKGLLIEDLRANPAHLGATWGIQQLGPGDKNILAGPTVQAAPAAAPPDTDLLNNTVALYLDEAGNNLKVRVRKSDGTYKTATVALV